MTSGGAGLTPSPTDRAAGRLSRLPIFSEQDYLLANPDVAAAGIDAVAHVLDSGAREGRTLFAETAVARAYGRAARGGAPAGVAGDWPRPGAPKGRRRCTVFLHSAGGDAHREVARDLVGDLASLGLEARLADERADPAADHGAKLFVAPHDFFDLGLGPLWVDALADGIVVLDDAVDAVEGGRSLRTALDARGVIDTSAVNAGLWSEAGIPTLHLRPRVRLRSRWLDEGDLAHPLMLAAPERARRPDCDPLAWDGRPLDLLYFERESPARNAALGRLAAALAAHRCFVYAQQGAVSRAEQDLHRGAHWRICGHLSAQARLTLFVAEGRFPALARRRVVVQAMAGGSAVVSTVRFADPGLDAGTHYFHEDARHAGALIDWLIGDPDGQRAALRTRERAFDRVAAWNRDPLRLAGLREVMVGSGVTAGGAP